MRRIKAIAVHCTATKPQTKVQSILNYWRKILKWRNPGYHFLVKEDGSIVHLLPIDQISNGVKFHNEEIINIAYIGGVDSYGKPKDTRTPLQALSLRILAKGLSDVFSVPIKGHRDFEGVKKACPSFNVTTEL